MLKIRSVLSVSPLPDRTTAPQNPLTPVFARKVGLRARWKLKRERKMARRQLKRVARAEFLTGKRLRKTARLAEKRRRSQRLQSKLTRSYLRVTVAGVVAVELFIGAFVALTRPSLSQEAFGNFLGTLFWSAVIVGVFSSIVGAGFGWFTAKNLTRRLDSIENAARAWGRGEFGVRAPDETPDEIGQLATRLNAMAQELRELVVLRQNLATAEERNRLARDLHDTVKQQVFATSMQIGAARLLLERDLEAARQRLDTAEQLARGAQSELTAILEQLRPGSYENVLQTLTKNTEIGLVSNAPFPLEHLARDWARQSGIALEWSGFSEKTHWSKTQEQTLLRIAQETLSNVARHSGASRVQIRLEQITKGNFALWKLTISDNGRGFDPNLSSGFGLGLKSLRERAESLPEGQLTIESSPNAGTRIDVTWKDAAAR